jgi:hypothetical protein
VKEFKQEIMPRSGQEDCKRGCECVCGWSDCICESQCDGIFNSLTHTPILKSKIF